MNIEKTNSNYFNRELSWLEFNSRVFEEAYDSASNPIMEQLKFLSITSSNLDEFFMVRVASLFDQMSAGYNETDIAGLLPAQQIKLILDKVHKMVSDQYSLYKSTLIPSLKKHHINFLKVDEVTDSQKLFLSEYFQNTVYPVLTPMAVDRSRPFPLIMNKSLNIAILLENEDKSEDPIFGTIQVPAVLDRLIDVSNDSQTKSYISLEDLIKSNIHILFSGYHVSHMSCYRITRNTDQGLDEDEAEDLLEAIQQYIMKRKWGMAVRLEVEKDISPQLLDILKLEFEIPDDAVFEIDGPLDLTFLMKLSSHKDFDHLKFPTYIPQPVKELMNGEDIFEAISQKDIFLHHPFDSFTPVIDLVKKAASDPKVLAIKQTLYRVSGNSPIVEYLAQAAENGKQVTVLLELKARFDEQNNIQWAKRLEMAGCHVIYGLVGLKTHSKILLIVRMEDDGIKRYVHLSTGNYNDVTAKFYTDMGILTANPYYGADASSIFNMLSGYSALSKLYKLYVAPLNLREKFLSLINQETENARNGKKAAITAKMNSLVDEKIINALYEASNAGVKINLIVRGICCLKPGVQGLSENINVRSIVGRFLEHSRIYYFYNNGSEMVYMSSADWMSRNLDRRVELLFPVEDKKIRNHILDILDIYLRDTAKARMLESSGSYKKVKKRGGKIFSSQDYLYKSAVKKINEKKKNAKEDLGLAFTEQLIL